jgi:hypothetical protein
MGVALNVYRDWAGSKTWRNPINLKGIIKDNIELSKAICQGVFIIIDGHINYNDDYRDLVATKASNADQLINMASWKRLAQYSLDTLEFVMEDQKFRDPEGTRLRLHEMLPREAVRPVGRPRIIEDQSEKERLQLILREMSAGIKERYEKEWAAYRQLKRDMGL